MFPQCAQTQTHEIINDRLLFYFLLLPRLLIILNFIFFGKKTSDLLSREYMKTCDPNMIIGRVAEIKRFGVFL